MAEPTVFLDGRVTLHAGDCLDVLAGMEADSVDCVVTSPPYWGLRDYGVEGQIGLEPTLAEHLDVMVKVFDAVRRVLKLTGTLWLNYGDCYATAPNGRSAADTKAAGTDDRTFRDKPFSTVGPIYNPEFARSPRAGGSQNRNHTAGDHGGRVVAGGYLKPKDLCMIPNRLAIALQDAGWWVRSECIWGKSNPMPDSSGAYRPSTAHEKVFLLTKSGEGDVWRARDTGEISFCPDLAERCGLITDPTREAARWTRTGAFYDANAVRLDSKSGDHVTVSGWGVAGEDHSNVGFNRIERKSRGSNQGRADKQRGHSRRHAGFNDRWDQMPRTDQVAGGRYLRNFEPAPLVVWPIATKPFSEAHFATFPPELAERCILAGCPHGGLVLDVFGGAGTTALAALRHGRRAALIELNPDYAAIARRRIEADWSLLKKREVAARRTAVADPAPLTDDLFA